LNSEPVIVIGSSGQDGYYLSHLLSKQGRHVIGLNRRQCIRNLTLPMEQIDITNRQHVMELLHEYQPTEVYYLAAYHRASETHEKELFSELKKSYSTHVDGLLNFLDAISACSRRTRLFYAASSHVFGEPLDVPQTEETPFRPICSYGITKAMGVEICQLYRRDQGVFASTGILYNHESPRRNIQFVTRKIIQTAVKIKQGTAHSLILGDLDAQTDWGAAEDYVVAMHNILQLEAADDFIVASGELHTIKELVEIVFDFLGLCSADYVQLDPSIIAKNKRERPLVGNSSKLKFKTGWTPTYNFQALIRHMVKVELNQSIAIGQTY
jgi:GDPmannose 4,6-dehydratase